MRLLLQDLSALRQKVVASSASSSSSVAVTVMEGDLVAANPSSFDIAIQFEGSQTLFLTPGQPADQAGEHRTTQPRGGGEGILAGGEGGGGGGGGGGGVGDSGRTDDDSDHDDEAFDETEEDEDLLSLQFMDEGEFDTFLEAIRKASGPGERRGESISFPNSNCFAPTFPHFPSPPAAILEDHTTRYSWTCHQLCNVTRSLFLLCSSSSP